MITMEKELEGIEKAHKLHWRRLDALEIISMLSNELVNTLFEKEEHAKIFCQEILEKDNWTRVVAKAGISYFTEPAKGADDNYKARVAGILSGIMAAAYSQYYNPLGFMGLVNYWKRVTLLEGSCQSGTP